MERVRSVSFQHLSGWKSAGAYRLRISTERQNIFLIFKNAVHTAEETPAIKGLPVCPGKPEYLILSQPPGPLKPFLPKVYVAREIISGVHYQYIMEDLTQDYRRARVADTLILRASGLLPKMHAALREWSAAADIAGMLDYAFLHSDQFYSYAYNNLGQLRERFKDSLSLNEVLDVWPSLIKRHSNLRRTAYSEHQPQLIHGDTNFSNLHLHKHQNDRLVIVDWEWAGFGHPMMDLAALLKTVDAATEQRGRETYHRAVSASPWTGGSAKSYLLNQFDRGLLDASYLSAHYLQTTRGAKFDLPRAVMNALGRVLASFRDLS
jgi:hypothetical protein